MAYGTPNYTVELLNSDGSTMALFSLFDGPEDRLRPFCEALAAHHKAAAFISYRGRHFTGSHTLYRPNILKGA